MDKTIERIKDDLIEKQFASDKARRIGADSICKTCFHSYVVRNGPLATQRICVEAPIQTQSVQVRQGNQVGDAIMSVLRVVPDSGFCHRWRKDVLDS